VWPTGTPAGQSRIGGEESSSRSVILDPSTGHPRGAGRDEASRRGFASATDDRLLTPRPFSTAPYARLVTRSRVLGRRPASTRGDVRRIVGPGLGGVSGSPDRAYHSQPTVTHADHRLDGVPFTVWVPEPIAPVTCWFVSGAIVGMIGLVPLGLGYLIMSRAGGVDGSAGAVGRCE
jgi:hypothetical protein